MNKTELIKNIANNTQLSQNQVKECLNSFISNIKTALCKNDNVVIIGFGTFLVRQRASRKGRNPQSGEEIIIKASSYPVFKPGNNFKADIKDKVKVKK